MRVPLRRSPAAPLVTALLGAAGLAACAPGGAGRAAEPLRDPSAGQPATTRIETTTGAAEVRTVSSTTPGVELAVSATADQVFAVLPQVYEGLGLPINTAVSATRTLGARDARAPRRIARQPLSRFLDCGGDATGLPHADAYTVTLSALSRVTPYSDARSAVVTQVVATARPASTSGNVLQCQSTGLLEQTINGSVALQVAGRR